MTYRAPLRRKKLSLLSNLPSTPLFLFFFFFSFSLSAKCFPETDLKVTGLDFLKSQNCSLHHTDAYNIKNLTVRRGQPFQLQLSFSRELRPTDKVALRFGIGKCICHLWPSGKAGEPQPPPAACPCTWHFMVIADPWEPPASHVGFVSRWKPNENQGKPDVAGPDASARLQRVESLPCQEQRQWGRTHGPCSHLGQWWRAPSPLGAIKQTLIPHPAFP